MANKLLGYVLVKGKEGDIVKDTVTVFASPACHRALRRGKNDTKSKTYTPTNNEEIRNEIKYQVKNAKPSVSGIGGVIASATESIIDIPDSVVDSIADSTAKEIVDEQLNIGGHTQEPINLEPTEAEEYYKTNLEKLQEVTNKMENLSFPVTSVSGLIGWFDDMEAVIDALPSMSKDGGNVYQVEKGEDSIWRYNGISEPMDREWNKKLQDAKASACLMLQKQVDKVTAKLEATLQEQINRMDNAGPFMRVIAIIQKVPSLTDIIDWAKGIIDFVVGIYKMIYGIYKMTVQLLEVIIIRFPQLINKIMHKITEYDCPLSYNIQINVKK